MLYCTKCGHKVHEADCHALAEECGTLPDEGVPLFGSVLVGRADDLDGRDQEPHEGCLVLADLHSADVAQRCRLRAKLLQNWIARVAAKTAQILVESVVQR